MAAAYNYNVAAAQLKWIIDDLRILAGDEIGPSSQSWQDVARNLASNLRQYADSMEAAAAGNVARKTGPVVFPSIDEII